MERIPCVYLLASGQNGTLYLGVTGDLVKRVWQHRGKFVDGFPARYETSRLVWFETHPTMEAAILRENQLKKWKRSWKLELIEGENPTWRDLYPELF